MNGVEYLIGSENIDNRPLRPFDNEVCDFVAALSEHLMADKKAKQYSDVISLAFWMRKGNIQKLKAQYGNETKRLGRGLVFHIAPANIPVNFAFSWLFGLLAGNANIVRVPSKPFPQTDIIICAISEVIEKFPSIKDGTAFVSYPANDETTAVFCARSDARIIWGGDNTVNNIRGFKTKPKCVDVVFPDRYSICIINGEAVLKAGEQDIERLAQAFYNDTYLMDQNACSSPQLILWQNAEDDAKDKFWHGVLNLVKKKYELQPAIGMNKYVQFCRDGIEYGDKISIKRSGNILYRANFLSLPENDLTGLRGVGGYFYEYDLQNLDELAAYLSEKYQTITYYGIDPPSIADYVLNSRLRGIDRIVPIGSAMDIGLVWDGYDLILTLSRVITTC